MKDFLAIILSLLITTAYAHLCLYSPRQRGPFFNNDIAQNECFRPIVPCGGQNFSGTIAQEIQSGQSFQVHFQQNLNHYSIGNPGYFSIAISRNPAPTKQSDFTPLAYITDYYPARQWLQTNFTIDVTLPDGFGTCDHCVIQVRYVPHKPSEPIFHQCSDVRVVASSSSKEKAVPASPVLSPFERMLRNSVPNAKDNLFGLYQTENGLYTVTIDPNSASFSMHSMLEGFVMSDGLKLTLKKPLQKMRIINNVAAVDVSKQRIFYLANSDYKFENPDDVADLLLVFDRNDPSKFQFTPLNNKGIPLSNLLYVPSKNSLFAWNIDSSQLKINLFQIDADTGRMIPSPVVTIDQAPPFVDYLWSGYDSTHNRIFMLVRHEDEGVTMPQRFYMVDLNAGMNVTQIELNSTMYYAWSEFFHDVKGDQLLVLTPGPAPALPVTGLSKWSMIRVAIDQKKPSGFGHPFTPGEQDFEYLINQPFSQVLNGTIVNAISQESQSYYKIVQLGVGKQVILTASTTLPKWSISNVNPELASVYNLVQVNP